jgi:hypothetical protein
LPTPFPACSKIEGKRALELAGVQFIDADDSGGEGVRLRRRWAIGKNGA